MQFMDTHIHLQDFKTKNATDIIEDAAAFGVEKMVCVSAAEDDWGKAAALARQFPNRVVPAFGLHPWYAREAQPGWEQRLAAYLEQYPQALVGEAGLDRFRDKEAEPQNVIFRAQVELAKEYNRPLSIHAVRAQGWLDDYWKLLPAKFVVHSFNGRRELLDKILKAGGYVSLSPSILRNPHKEEIVPLIPLERLLLETDGPSQSLNRGSEGTPRELPILAVEIAALRNEKNECLSARVYQNSMEFINAGK